MALGVLPLTTIGIIIIAAIALSVLVKKLGQNPVLGFIVAGFLLGPFLLKFLHPEDALVLGFSEMGLFILLFYLGLELSIKDFLAAGSASFGLAIIDMIASAGAGFIIGQLLGFSFIFSVALGFMLFSTSTAVVAKFAIDNNILRQQNVQLAVSILILQDFLGILFIVLLTTASHATSAPSLALRAVVFAVAAFYAVYQLSKFVEEWLTKHDYSHTEITLYAVGIGLVVATLASVLGLSTALGAYFAGFALAATQAGNKIKKDINFLRDFFLVFFFVAFGTTIFYNPHAASIILPSIDTLLFFGAVALLLAGLAFIAHTLACALFGPLFGLSRQDSSATAILLLPLGEFVVIIATATTGVLGPEEAALLPIIAFMLILFTVVSFQPLYSRLSLHQKLVSMLPTLFEKKQPKTEIKPHTSYTMEQAKAVALNAFVVLSIAWVALLLYEELPRFNVPLIYSREITTVIVFGLFAFYPVYNAVRAFRKIFSHNNPQM